jgi:hypothetical protein
MRMADDVVDDQKEGLSYSQSSLLWLAYLLDVLYSSNEQASMLECMGIGNRHGYINERERRWC